MLNISLWKFMLRPLLLVALISNLTIYCAAQFAGGNGSAENPWQIATAVHLNNVRNYLGADHNDKHFIQTADIDLGVPPWNEGRGWERIGTTWPAANRFRGHYDGNFFKISNLMINREGLAYPDNEILALFGCLEAGSLRKIILENFNVIGEAFVAGLVGQVTSNALIKDCSVSGELTGGEYVGAITGSIGANSRVENCSTFGSIRGTNRMIGGIVGMNAGIVVNCYSRMSVSGVNNRIGGIVGVNNAGATISRCYSTGQVTGPDGAVNIGGLAGSNSGTIEQSYWDIETSLRENSAGGIGRLTRQMTFPYDEETFVGWNFVDVWQNDTTGHINAGYPVLFYQAGMLDRPVVVIERTLINNIEHIFIRWEAVEGANSYKIFSSGNPYAIDWGQPIAVTNETSFSEAVNVISKFYHVVASPDEMP